MSYYPILTAPGCTGQTTLHNFPPNSWEDKSKDSKLINLTWVQDGLWRSEVLGEIAFGAMRTFSQDDVAGHVPIGTLPLLSLCAGPLPSVSDVLSANGQRTNMPAWRATLGLESLAASTCYQGELDPFPVPGSLLTFAPFVQFGEGIENYLLLLNLEKNPQKRTSQVEIYDSANPGRIVGCFEVCNNSVSVVSLDGLGIEQDDLPAIVCKGMSGIPLYFSKTLSGSNLSLEHTHPPASYVIHGRRWEAQKLLKNKWFSRLGLA